MKADGRGRELCLEDVYICFLTRRRFQL
jgi:hypothetical protein